MTSVIASNASIDFKIKRDLRIGFTSKQKTFRAINCVSFSFNRGDHVGVLGHNGAGKTTLLRAIAGVLPISGGDIQVEGNVQAALTLRTGLLNEGSCLENIRLRAYQYGFKGKDAESYVERVRHIVDLEDFIYQPLKTLSNGMRSRLMIGMFTMNEHSIIIFDEWVGVLDRTQLGGVASLRMLVDNADISVLASHNTGFIRKYCNRCIVLDHGGLVFDGDVEESIRLYRSLPSSGGHRSHD